MKPASDPTADYKALVKRGYDSCAAEYDAARPEEIDPTLAALIDRLDLGAIVLDVGCGGGVPVARKLARRFTVTGVDISSTMIERAQMNVPEGFFIQGDIMAVNFQPAYFDAVVAFYSIFHLPREEHDELFGRIHRWLKPGGFLMATVGMKNEPAYLEEDFYGVTMYWSNYGLEEYKKILTRLGFHGLEVTIVGHGYTETLQTAEELHPLIIAQKSD
jgi:ubiquinone/menaquinone biosynthesis C-methylase UbiE